MLHPNSIFGHCWGNKISQWKSIWPSKVQFLAGANTFTSFSTLSFEGAVNLNSNPSLLVGIIRARVVFLFRVLTQVVYLKKEYSYSWFCIHTMVSTTQKKRLNTFSSPDFKILIQKGIESRCKHWAFAHLVLNDQISMLRPYK